MRTLSLLLAVAPLVAAGCDGDSPTPRAAGEEGGAAAGAAAGVSAGAAAGASAGAAAGESAGGAGESAGGAAGASAGVTAGASAGAAAGVSAGAAAGASAGSPAGVEAGSPAGVEAGSPAGVEAGSPAGVEAGVPAGVEAGAAAGGAEVPPGFDVLDGRLTYQGSVPPNGAEEHAFAVTEESYVVIYTSDGAGACPADADTTLTLYSVDAAGGREQLAYNDDFLINGNFTFCSRLERLLPAGSYVAEVRAFGGGGVERYTLDVVISPPLALGDACDPADPALGRCAGGLACVAGACADALPVITSAVAYERRGELFVTLSGQDPNGDAAVVDIIIYDGAQNILDLVFRRLEPVGNDFELRYSSATIFDLADATQVGFIAYDFEGNASQELIVPLAPLPTLALGDACEAGRYSGACDAGLICEGAACAQGLTPTATAAYAETQGTRLVLSLDGADPNDDVVGIEASLYDQVGEPLLFEGARTFTLPIAAARVTAATPLGARRYFAVIADLSAYPRAAAVDLSLVDSTELRSAPAQLALIEPMRVAAFGASCDLDRLEVSCGAGFCVPAAAGGGECIERFPAYGEACAQVVGCDEGLVCYGPSNGGDYTSLYNTCYTACDENAPVVGCGAGETCVPDFPWREFGITTISSPGFCLPNDGCDPGAEDDACGAGDSFCLRINATTVCVDLSAQDPENISAAGEPCGGDDYCPEGFACEYGVCRAACALSADCASGETCLSPFEGEGLIGYSFCFPNCDVYAQDCPNGEVCALLDFTATETLGLCRAGSTQGAGAQGASPDPSANPNYWATCTGAHGCYDLLDDGNDACYALCSNTTNPCTGNTVCVDDFLTDPYGGICFGECDYFSGDGCAAGESCLISTMGPTQSGEEKAVGFCRANANLGALQSGAACVSNNVDFTSNCAVGHLCANVYGTGEECVKLCTVDEAGAVVEGCPAGLTCLYETLNGPVFESLPRLGICID